MPSEPGGPVERLLPLLEPAMAEFRSVVAEAHEEIRAWQAEHDASGTSPGVRLRSELGLFARDRVDPTRLAALLDPPAEVDPLTHQLMMTVGHRYADLMRQGAGAFRVQVPTGGDLRDAVRDALAEVGRVFALARVVEKARNRGYAPDRDTDLLGPWPFHRWNRLEKEAAPPLCVEVEGDDLRAPGLAEFLEGTTRLVLAVRGPVRPAPLARLVSSQVYVAQVAGGDAPERVKELLAGDGPGVVAVFEEGAGALPFVQRPGAALEVDRAMLDEALSRTADVRGQPGILDLRHLEVLARASGAPGPAAPAPAGSVPGVASTPGGSAPSAEPATVDRLAAWLLARTDVSIPGAEPGEAGGPPPAGSSSG